ncbi:MAG: hypothetical protein ACO1QS_18435 [Verrucomicrobiota bacterium]
MLILLVATAGQPERKHQQNDRDARQFAVFCAALHVMKGMGIPLGLAGEE